MVIAIWRYKISPNVRHLWNIWEYAAFVSNSLIFAHRPSVKIASFSEYALPALVALAVFGRDFIGSGVAPIVNRFCEKEGKLSFSWQFVLSWGGLRGLPLAIVLLLPHDFEHRKLFGTTLATIFYACD